MKSATFEAVIYQNSELDDADNDWCFIVLPKQISDILPRRGRASANIKVNDYTFDTVLEPDGQLSHWLKIDKKVLKDAKLSCNQSAIFTISPLANELEPILPDDVQAALAGNPIAQMGWYKTTVIARIDWVHWIVTAKQARTRAKRINDMLNMLCDGKLRVCCFDQSGFYSKAFKAPTANII